MSDAFAANLPAERLPFAALAATASGFVSDPRFGAAAAAARTMETEVEDPLARAWSDGHAAGYAEAQAEAQARAEADDAARTRIEMKLARLDAEHAEELRQRLLATVEALCESAIAPLALDKDALLARVTRAAGMLARADDERVLRLHPDDLKLVAKRLPADLEVQPDPRLERGAIRVEAANGGVEDGPDNWRRAIAEALSQC